VRALEALLIEKGVLGSDSVDTVLAHFETMAGPFNGARIVARAWIDAEFRGTSVEDTPKAIAEMDFPAQGMDGAEGEHMLQSPTAPTCTT
jgi:nitrile hydratase